jgi:hypothetical protein
MFFIFMTTEMSAFKRFVILAGPSLRNLFGSEQLYFLPNNGMQFYENQPTFQRNKSLLSSGPKSNPSKKPAFKYSEAGSRVRDPIS